MISSVTINGHTLKMGARAMQALEQQNDGKDIASVLEVFEHRPSITAMVQVLRECLNDGDGGDADHANKTFDDVGFDGLMKVIAAAFPKAKGETKTGAKKTKAAPVG